jgi:hypothetical protein
MCGCQYVLKPQVVQALSGRGLTSYRCKSHVLTTHHVVCPLGRNLPLMESHVVGHPIFYIQKSFLTRHSPLLNFGFLFLPTKRPTPTFQSHQPSFPFQLKTMFRCPTLLYPPIAQQISHPPSLVFLYLNSKTAYHTSFLQSYSLFSFLIL